jgi:hypothetical protein
MAANNPDRRDLPVALRLSEKAASKLGLMNLYGTISERQYEAGRRFCVIAGHFKAAICGPRSGPGNGRGYSCNPEACLIDSKDCICEARIKRFNECVSALIDESQAVYSQTYKTAVSDEWCLIDRHHILICGLNRLARHLGIDK